MSFPQFPEIGSTFMPPLYPPLTESSVWLGEEDELTQLARIEAAANDRFDSSSALPSSVGAGSSPSYVPPEFGNEGAEMEEEDSDNLEFPPSMDGAQLSSSENTPMIPITKTLGFRIARRARARFEPALLELAQIMLREEELKPNHPAIRAWRQEHLTDVIVNHKQCVACKKEDKTTAKVRAIGITLCESCRKSLSLKKKRLKEQAEQLETSSEVVNTMNRPHLKPKRARFSQSSEQSVSTGASKKQSHRLRGRYRILSGVAKEARNKAISELIGIALDQNPDQIERTALEWKTRPSPSSVRLEDVCEACRTTTWEKTSKITGNVFINLCNSCYHLFQCRKSDTRKAKALSTPEQLN